MRKLYIIALLLISLESVSQTYLQRYISNYGALDTGYVKYGSDSLYHLVNGSYVAFAKSKIVYTTPQWGIIGLQDSLNTRAYVGGSSSITTVGTVTSGVWNATAIGDAYISSASTWNAKQTALSGTGLVSFSGTTPSYNTTSASIAGIISDETGSGSMVFGTSPTLTTPVLGVATATSINKVTITAPATSSTLTIADGSSLVTSGAFSTTLTATGATNVTLPTSGTLYGTATGSITSANLLGSLSDETGSGVAVFATSPTLVTPTIGVATATSINKVTITAPATGSTLTVADGSSLITSGAFALTLTSTATSNATIPAGTNTLYSTLSGSITSAQLGTSLTDESGSGTVAFTTSPTFVTPTLGAATATSINKVTITAPTTSATLTLVTGSSLITAGAFALTLTSTATSNATIPAGTNTLYSTLASSITSAQMASSLTNETGTGLVVFGTTPVITWPYVSKALSYTAVTTDEVIEVTATGQTITLPTAVGVTGKRYTIKLTSATSTCTVNTTSSQTIDGSTTYSLSAQYKYVTVSSNGANWNIIANN